MTIVLVQTSDGQEFAVPFSNADAARRWREKLADVVGFDGSHQYETVLPEVVEEYLSDADAQTKRDAVACPGCGSVPGDGATVGCIHPNGCGQHLVIKTDNGVWSLQHTGSRQEFYGGKIGEEMYDRLTRRRQTPKTIALEMNAAYGVDVETIELDVASLIATMQGR